jgi:hypothetical protein
VLVLVALAFAMVAVPDPERHHAGSVASAFEDRAAGANTRVVWAVGDGADGGEAAREVAAMIASGRPDRFLYLGDVYESGTALEFERNYEPTFGRLKPLTLPTPGNHDWPRHSEGFDSYWAGTRATMRRGGFYAVSVAGWRLIAINSEAAHGRSSRQWRWLRRQLSGGGDCRIAFWHRPRYSAGSHGDQPDLAPVWRLLRGRARLVLNGHEHNMQRLERINGVTTLISGAGGRSHYDVDRDYRRLRFAETGEDGALRLVLRPGVVRWRFLSVSGEVLDHGRRRCERR